MINKILYPKLVSVQVTKMTVELIKKKRNALEKLILHLAQENKFDDLLEALQSALPP